MKQQNVFLNCIAKPFLAAIACLLLMVFFHLNPVRIVLMRILFTISRRIILRADSYFRIANILAILPCALFCCRSAFKQNSKKKLIIAIISAVIISIVFGFVSNFVLSLVNSQFRLTAWGLVLNFLVAAVFLILFNLFFTEEFREARKTYVAMEKARKEAEQKANLAVFMSSPTVRNQMARDAVAYKSKENSVVKGAVIGGIVAGPAGAVVGAVVGKNKADQKASASSLDPARQAVAYKKDDGTKTIIKDAVIGGAIAGPTGAVIGAMAGKNKVDQENK